MIVLVQHLAKVFDVVAVFLYHSIDRRFHIGDVLVDPGSRRIVHVAGNRAGPIRQIGEINRGMQLSKQRSSRMEIHFEILAHNISGT